MRDNEIPLRVAYFAHDWGDSAIKRRVAGFERDGLEVYGFASYRMDPEPPDWIVVNLGRTFDNGYAHRAGSIIRGARKAQNPSLSDADVIVARNLDMLLTAALARRRAGLGTPLVYECLDIHRLVARRDPIGGAFRLLERNALHQCSAVWVSSPAFQSEHFEKHYPDVKGVQLLENRLQTALGQRCTRFRNNERKLRIGWFGNLRCARSLELMCSVAERFRTQVEISLRGYPATAKLPDFQRIVDAHANIEFGGRYAWPDELEAIYDSVDLVWAGDFMDASLNSDWLLPNRLYEGGWFGCPPAAPKSSQTGKWIAGHGAGFVLEEPMEQTLPALVDTLLNDPAPLVAARTRLLDLPRDVFVEPVGTLRIAVVSALDRGLSGRQDGSAHRL
ncbi:MAG: hypothetical protein AAGA28_17580 [Pseudomonadota bacterium]